MKTLSVSFKNCSYSPALEACVEAGFDDAVTLVHRTSIASMHVTISEENGVYTAGPDVFQCLLVASFDDGKTIRIVAEDRSPYAAVDELFVKLRRVVAERKRRHVQVRNDVRARKLRRKAVGES